ncbi:hypothetical protein [Streptomyces sp. NPDC090036]|uniref:hypothetical protein n=1 Tax=Streptomyces sp. NPDC090036 TaxID=3365926 RepID=UPI003800D372
MNAAQVLTLFRQQYLTDGPTSPVHPVHVAFTDNTDFVVVDIILGPPEFSFSSDTDEPQCQLSMFLVSGSLLRVDPINSVVRSVLSVEPRSSWLNGPVQLSSVQGSDNVLGQVTLNLADAAYQPTISGIDPRSTMLTELGTALQTYFDTQQTSYPLGTIQQSPVSACLQPTQFDFAVQQNPDKADDGAVLLLITTNGTAPTTVGPLPVYPIPDGDMAALLVSGEVLFSSLIAPTLTQEFTQIGTTFSAQQIDGAYYQVNGSGGQLDLGYFPPGGQPDQYGVPWASDHQDNYQKVVLTPDSFTVSPNSSSLVSTWTCSFLQYFSEYPETPGWTTPVTNNCELGTTVTTTYTAAADPATDIVSFSGTTVSSLTPDNPGSWWSDFRNGVAYLPGDMQTALGQAVQSALQEVKLPDVDTFALQNLLFPSEQVLQLATAGVPGDLQLTGHIESTLTVSPPSVTIDTAGQQQFGAVNAGSPIDVDWEIQPGLGTIDSNGLYQAPDAVGQPVVIIVTAIDQTDASLVGKAMVVLAPAAPTSGVTVTPGALTLTAGQSYDLLVVDSNDQPTDATCTLSPPGVGTLTQGFSTGAWIYTAPATVTQPQSVSISPGTSGRAATVQLAPTTTLTITASATTLNPGDTVTLTVDADDLEQVSWVSNPTGFGTLNTAEGSASATFTAPASVQTEQSPAVMAWGQNPDIGIGIGLCRLTVLAG